MSTSTEVMQVTTALAEFDKVAAGLAELEKSYKGVLYPVETKEGMKAAILARRAIKEPRVAVEKLRKEAKAPILALGKKLDSEAARITAALESLEGPIDAQIKQEEDRLNNEAVANATAERERVEALEARLEALQLMPFDAQGLTSAQSQACLDEARALVIGDDWQEYAEKAERAKISAVAALEGMVASAKDKEAEAARIIAERAELDKLRAEAAARDQVERARQAAEAAKVAAEQKAEAERLAAVKAEQDRIEAERLAAHVKIEAEAAAVRKAEQDKLDAERVQFEKDKAIAAAEAKERTRIDQVGFRAHHENLTPEQKERLRADSDANPAADVYSLAIFVPEPPKPVIPPVNTGSVEAVAAALKPIDEATERAEFEVWVYDEFEEIPERGKNSFGHFTCYNDYGTELAWQSWLERARRG